MPQNAESDGALTCFPVSVKGVLFVEGKVVLLRNEREEWELPGGEPGILPKDSGVIVPGGVDPLGEGRKA